MIMKPVPTEDEASPMSAVYEFSGATKWIRIPCGHAHSINGSATG